MGLAGTPKTLAIRRVHRESPPCPPPTTRSPARDLQPPGLVQPRRPIRRTDCAGRGAHRCGAAARRRRRSDRVAANRADAAVHPVCDSRRPARRPDFAPRRDGGRGSTARSSAGGDPAAALVWADDVADIGAARLRRGVRHRGLQRCCAGFGAVAGYAAATPGGECADRTGAHDRLCERPRGWRRAGRMGRRCACVRLCRGAVDCRGSAAVRNLRASAFAGAAASSAAGHQGRRRLRASSPAAAAGVHHPVHLQHGIVPAARGVRALRRAPSRAFGDRRRHHPGDVRRRHGGRRALRDTGDEAPRFRHRDRRSARSPASPPPA